MVVMPTLSDDAPVTPRPTPISFKYSIATSFVLLFRESFTLVLPKVLLDANDTACTGSLL